MSNLQANSLPRIFCSINTAFFFKYFKIYIRKYRVGRVLRGRLSPQGLPASELVLVILVTARLAVGTPHTAAPCGIDDQLLGVGEESQYRPEGMARGSRGTPGNGGTGEGKNGGGNAGGGGRREGERRGNGDDTGWLEFPEDNATWLARATKTNYCSSANNVIK